MWLKVQEFDAREDAGKAVLLDGSWKTSSSQYSNDGHKIIFRCSRGKYRTAECPAQLYLLFHSDNDKVSLFKTNSEHANHETNPDRGLPHGMKMVIRQLFNEGIRKPNFILDTLRNRNLSEPAKAKVVYYLQQLRREKYGQPTVSGSDITKWCTERITVPSDKDTPFVLNYLVHTESLNI